MSIKTCIQCAGREVEPTLDGTCPMCGGIDYMEDNTSPQTPLAIKKSRVISKVKPDESP